MTQEIMIMSLPPKNGEITGCWYNGYPVHQGASEESLNFASWYANHHNIIPDQRVLRNEWKHWFSVMSSLDIDIHCLEFPPQLNQKDHLFHDAVFVRDHGFRYKNKWIQANVSADGREEEIYVMSQLIKSEFPLIEFTPLPKSAKFEGGDVLYLDTDQGRFYIGGLSRSNLEGHSLLIDIIQPDKSILLTSEGYHLDTVLTPLLSKTNTLEAFLVISSMLEESELAKLRQCDVPLINVDPRDGSGVGDSLGNYAINGLALPGVLVNCSRFDTPGVEETISNFGIEHHITPLTYFRYAGGSVHCLTNEFYL